MTKPSSSDRRSRPPSSAQQAALLDSRQSDGRALRIVSKHERLAPPRDLFRTAVQTIARDIEEELEQQKLRAFMHQPMERMPAHIFRGDDHNGPVLHTEQFDQTRRYGRPGRPEGRMVAAPRTAALG